MKVMLPTFGNASHCRNTCGKIRNKKDKETHWKHVQKWSDSKTEHINKWLIAEFFLKKKRQASYGYDWLIDLCTQNRLSHIATITCLRIREEKEANRQFVRKEWENSNIVKENIWYQENKCHHINIQKKDIFSTERKQPTTS